jgi:hypothetical protein
MERANGDQGISQSWLAMGGLKNQSLPKQRSKEARKLLASLLSKEGQ